MISLEFYEEGKKDGDPLAYVYVDRVVPRIGEQVYLKRVDKILGVDPEKEHPHWEVISVEHYLDVSEVQILQHGIIDKVAILVRRVDDSIWD